MVTGCSSSTAKYDRALSIAIGVAIAVVTLLYVRSWFGFGFALAFALVLIGAGWKLSHEANELILKTIGVTSVLYAPLDVFDDVIARRGIGSDADKLADLTMLPSVVWGVIWIALSFVAAACFLYFSVRRPE